jgi:hypothetical protein
MIEFDTVKMKFTVEVEVGVETSKKDDSKIAGLEEGIVSDVIYYNEHFVSGSISDRIWENDLGDHANIVVRAYESR